MPENSKTKTPNKGTQNGVRFECLTGSCFSYGVEFTPVGVIEDERLIEKARLNPDFKEVKK